MVCDVEVKFTHHPKLWLVLTLAALTSLFVNPDYLVIGKEPRLNSHGAKPE